ncbi:MAG: hypothetical protein CMC79_03255 [Flavobacteriaceae bacterium]|nr:hypothetical protein [Flavobacteriaceae bacterium]|tara:strand:- start:6855 stop:7637 length:783 start_codon:yes stop_codon:yes gene_type:complete
MHLFYLKSRFLFILLVIFNFFACKTLTVLPNNKPIKNLKTSELTSALNTTAPKISSLRSRVKVIYDDGKRKQQLIVNLRIKKSKALWLSANMIVPVAKLLVTPESVSFYEKFQKTFYDGDIIFINKIFGTNFGYENIESLLLGKPVLDIKKGKWEQIKHPDFYVLTPKINKEKFKPIFFFDPSTLLLKEQRFILNNNESLIIFYNDFQKVEGKFLPSNTMIIYSDGIIQTKISLEYTRSEIPDNLTFPFNIPEGYSRIKV